jgi:hypothetical protein
VNNLSRFLLYMDISTSGCWLWTGGIGTRGYGKFWLDGRTVQAHRASYILFVGPILPGLLVLHSCDTPPCVNPEHLWLGTDADNAKDRDGKGRYRLGARNPRRGEMSSQARMTNESAAQIPILIRKGLSNKAVATLLGVSPSAISAIRTGHLRRELWPLFQGEAK